MEKERGKGKMKRKFTLTLTERDRVFQEAEVNGRIVRCAIYGAMFQCTKCGLWGPASDFGLLFDKRIQCFRNQPQHRDCRRPKGNDDDANLPPGVPNPHPPRDKRGMPGS